MSGALITRVAGDHSCRRDGGEGEGPPAGLARPGQRENRRVYQRINLRALRAAELLDAGPPALWALVALTRDGADAPAIERARDAIEGYPGWSGTVRADNLAVLWFVAGAEGVPRRLLEAAISMEKLMENEFFRELAAEWVVEGRTAAKAQDVLAVLEARGLSVSETIRGRILACKDLETLDAWIRRAAVAGSAAAVVRSTKARTRSEGPKAARRPRH